MLNFVSLWLISAAVFSSPQARPKIFDRKAQIGVVDFRQGRPLCLSIEDGALPTGSLVYLVFPTRPQRLLTAVVEKKLAASCSADPDTPAAASFYELRLTDGGSVAPGEVSIALSKTARPTLSKSGSVSVDFEGDGRREYFRSCTSSEGVHLTIWRGRPPAGERIWHRYYYLGYDVEPSCTKRESSPSE